MRILQLFATYSGSTQAASEILSQELTSHHTVRVKSPGDVKPDEIKTYDVVIFCTPTWDLNGLEGQPHELFIEFIHKAKGVSFTGTKFAVMGLGDSSYTHFCGSVDVLEGFIKSAGGTLIIPSLRIDGFFYNQEKHTESIKKWAHTLTDTLHK